MFGVDVFVKSNSFITNIIALTTIELLFLSDTKVSDNCVIGNESTSVLWNKETLELFFTRNGIGKNESGDAKYAQNDTELRKPLNVECIISI